MTCDLYAICEPLSSSSSVHNMMDPLAPAGRGSCVCPTSCDEIRHTESERALFADADRVCGTDGRTYDSLCQLKIEACRKQQHIVAANGGDCGECGIDRDLFPVCTSIR